MFDNFINVFGSGKKAAIELRTKGDEPTIRVTSQATYLSMQAELAIKNPLNSEIDAI